MDKEKTSEGGKPVAPYKIEQANARAALRPRPLTWQGDGLCNRCGKSLLHTSKGKRIKSKNLEDTLIKFHPECRKGRHNRDKATR